MTTKKRLIEIYTSMVEDGEGDLLYAEISECKRLKELYQERLRCLIERDPKLALVREGAVHMYTLYETHFRKKIHENVLGVAAATEVLNKWQTEQRNSNKYMKMWGDLVHRLLDSQSEGLVCK